MIVASLTDGRFEGRGECVPYARYGETPQSVRAQIAAVAEAVANGAGRQQLLTLMKPGAEFRVATDIPDYVRQTLEQVPRHGFEWLAERPEDWRRPWEDWISTRYEQKALREGRVPHYLTFRKT